MEILAASSQIKAPSIGEYILMGELALDGKIRPIKGVLPIAIQALKDGFKGIVLPKENEREAAIVKGLEVYGMDSLTEVIAFLKEINLLAPKWWIPVKRLTNS